MIDGPAPTMARARRLRQEDAAAFQVHEYRRLEESRARQQALGAITHWLPAPGATKVPQAGPLSGFDAALKANIAAAGAPTHCGSLFLEDYRSPFDATVVRRLREAGVHFSAVTAMDEFGMGSSSEFSQIGRPVNPHDPRLSAGGSSGGSAAAVAAGHVYFALGSDTGGSVRQPAHCCGVVGLKPTWGRVSRHGLVAFASSLDTIGVLARCVADAWDVLRTMAGADPLDATSQDQPALESDYLTEQSWRGVVCAVPEDLEAWDVDHAVLAHQKENEAHLRSLGATLQPVPLKRWGDGLAIYTVLNAAQAASNLQRFDGTLYGRRGAGSSHRESLVAGRTAGFGPEVQRRILLGCHVLSGGFRDRYYLRARAGRQALTENFRHLFGGADILAGPTAPTAAFPLGTRLRDPVAMRRSDIFTVPASLAGLPAVSLPTGTDPAGLPLSLQLVAPWWRERRLCALAASLESSLGKGDSRG